MKIDDTIYYTPHQLASFFSIRKDTLLFYDKIGLFSPVKRKSNGYRCYSATQLNELDTILTLKDLGIPLSVIKDVVGDMNAPSFLSLLQNEEDSIRKKIEECRALLAIVGSIKSSIKEAMESEKERLYVSALKKTPIITVPIRNTEGMMTDDDCWQDAYSTLMAEADCKAIITIGSIVRLEEAREYLGGICREVYATYARPSDKAIPGGRYASMFFSGSLDNLSSFYKCFLAALDNSNLHPSGDIYEELSISPIVAREETEHVTKLMVKIE